MLKICAFKWGDKYSVEHVRRLYNMLARNLTIPWRFVLITDQPAEDGDALRDAIPAAEIVPLWQDMRDAKLCGVRIRAFGADMAEVIGPRFAWIDLDVVIVGNVDHIFGRTDDFVGLATPRPPLPFNGSFVMMDAGARREVYDEWTPEQYAGLPDYWAKQGVRGGAQSDEGWMGWAMGNDGHCLEARIGRPEGVLYFRHDLREGRNTLPSTARMVIMNGLRFDPSFPALQRRCPWIKEHWR